MYGSIQDVNSEWCTIHHLLGCSLLAQARREASGASTEKKVNEAISCFFRYAYIFTTNLILNILENSFTTYLVSLRSEETV